MEGSYEGSYSASNKPINKVKTVGSIENSKKNLRKLILNSYTLAEYLLEKGLTALEISKQNKKKF